MKLNEFIAYFIASCVGAAIYILFIYIFNPGYSPNLLHIGVKVVIIAAVMSLSIMFFKKKMGDKSE